MRSHSLTNLEIQKYYQNEPKFNEIYSRANLANKIKDGAYVIILDEYSDVGTSWIALYALNNDITYFYGVGVNQKKLNVFLVMKICKQSFL